MIRHARRGVVMVMAILLAIGVVMVYSSSAIYAHHVYGDSLYFLKRHLVYLVLGLIGFGVVLGLPSEVVRRSIKPAVVLTLVLLAAVLVPGLGHRVSGASRWFRMGWFSFQPSEWAQLAIILYFADVLARKRSLIQDFFKGVLPALVVLGMTVGLILAEPDLGTAMATACVAMLLLFIAGVRWQVLAFLILAAIPTVIFLIAMKPYRMQRILTYLDPWADPKGSGFQLIQSLIALGSGGLMGVGLGESRQKLFYLPAAHTDFVFSVIGEEMGFVGTMTVLVLLGLLFWLGLKISLSATTPFGLLAGLGIVSLLALEASVHIGVATGIIPTKGLPLPFVSYGGTSLMANLVSVAVLLNVTRPCGKVDR
jgi:cell division protein FtsW